MTETFTPVIAPYVPTYAARQSYITPGEFTEDPNGVDVSQLVAGGNAYDNAAALLGVISDGSAWVDAICHQVLGATEDVQAGRYRVNNRGIIAVQCAYSPIVAVNAVSLGPTPQTLTALTDSTGIWPNGKTVEIPFVSNGLTPSGAYPYPSGWVNGRDVYATVTYVNGFANTTLAEPATAGTSEITVVSALGVVAGSGLGLYDGSSTEGVTVAASYTYGSTTVPLAAPLTFAHAEGVAASALPPAVRRATKLLTAALIKTRGDEAFVMASINSEPTSQPVGEPGLAADVDIATRLLVDYIRVQ